MKKPLRSTKKSSGVFCFIFVCFLCACGANDTPAQNSDTQLTVGEYQKISAKEAKGIMDQGKPYILLDVRTDQEYKEERIEGAILIPDYEIKSRAPAELSNKEAVILIYCRSGRRSAEAAHNLIEMGYQNVYDFGGIIDWPYGTVKE